MYKEKTDKELIEICNAHKNLTFQSQLNLRDELNHRNMIENLSSLENTIELKINEIDNLKYLKDIGFRAEKNGNSIKITRNPMAIITDVTAVFLGVILLVVGLYGVMRFLSSVLSESDFNFFAMVMDLAMIALGNLGIKFLNGLKRLIDFSGFELIRSKEIVILKKRFDVKLVELKKSITNLNLEKQANRLVLKLENDEIFYANADNRIQIMTLNALNRELKADSSEKIDTSMPESL